ncbi:MULTISPECIES: hypothetical protein [unclassified Rhodococcus (in: high G+C Gram-positive bacteria)]|uniref:hypothetical protein n=1 Tax=unclassified Rhodococcus (in: high G+C Gram-positive bacteria) TaxID=192944 RepID=UPI00339AA846
MVCDFANLDLDHSVRRLDSLVVCVFARPAHYAPSVPRALPFVMVAVSPEALRHRVDPILSMFASTTRRLWSTVPDPDTRVKRAREVPSTTYL